MFLWELEKVTPLIQLLNGFQNMSLLFISAKTRPELIKQRKLQDHNFLYPLMNLEGWKNNDSFFCVVGSLNAICDVTGTLPEVEFELKCDKHQFDAFLVHPCVKEHESIVNNEIKVKLCPPVEAFNVVNYNLPGIFLT